MRWADLHDVDMTRLDVGRVTYKKSQDEGENMNEREVCEMRDADGQQTLWDLTYVQGGDEGAHP